MTSGVTMRSCRQAHGGTRTTGGALIEVGERRDPMTPSAPGTTAILVPSALEVGETSQGQVGEHRWGVIDVASRDG